MTRCCSRKREHSTAGWEGTKVRAQGTGHRAKKDSEGRSKHTEGGGIQGAWRHGDRGEEKEENIWSGAGTRTRSTVVVA
eukprot:761317-Hanusia_phi.AAC.3